MTSPEWLITCEHGGNLVPKPFQSHFATPGAARALNSHRGYDPGALEAATQFAKAQVAELISSETTRLLVDLNRSQDNPGLYSPFTSNLSASQRATLLDDWYYPYRKQVEGELRSRIQSAGCVVHLSIHTFTPRFKGTWRPIDVGFLFDPVRAGEAAFCQAWLSDVKRKHPRVRAVANQPYAGTDDGFTTALRQKFADSNYLGIEVEISHRFWKRSPQSQKNIVRALLETIPPH
ncbi:N-formylglutamate amidohydrolase [Rubripirellula reticaptiva]|uniref:N-formylglutamate amidohydrolase n=1 Tax=Rubripirellula reticaptiva TaxID=2528013 RepID=A0A5C6EIB5_9BACT|nr:N-formylglutamate amidohydrolase [Rubripirellula reticaptiva]TWU46999.1 N-formylglutamate amidohydrolase [Rubripirellula reticaptiva]